MKKIALFSLIAAVAGVSAANAGWRDMLGSAPTDARWRQELGNAPEDPQWRKNLGASGEEVQANEATGGFVPVSEPVVEEVQETEVVTE